jgi:hypothetical protein
MTVHSPRDDWLANANRLLVEPLFAAYGWATDLTDDQVLARLLDLNVRREPLK